MIFNIYFFSFARAPTQLPRFSVFTYANHTNVITTHWYIVVHLKWNLSETNVAFGRMRSQAMVGQLLNETKETAYVTCSSVRQNLHWQMYSTYTRTHIHLPIIWYVAITCVRIHKTQPTICFLQYHAIRIHIYRGYMAFCLFCLSSVFCSVMVHCFAKSTRTSHRNRKHEQSAHSVSSFPLFSAVQWKIPLDSLETLNQNSEFNWLIFVWRKMIFKHGPNTVLSNSIHKWTQFAGLNQQTNIYYFL